MSYFNLSLFKKSKTIKTETVKFNPSDEKWKKEAILALDQQLAAFNQLTYSGLRQNVYKN